MSDDSVSSFPVFNHVAMSLSADLLGETGRAEILRFYGEVFGWTEMPTMTEDRKRLVLRVHSNEQFVFLVADDQPMRCPEGDHFGMSVETPDELNRTLESARKFQQQDDRVEIIEGKIEASTRDGPTIRPHGVEVGGGCGISSSTRR